MRQEHYELYKGWGIYLIHDYNGYWITVYAGHVNITLEFPELTFEDAMREAKFTIDTEMEKLGL